jgi:hypothetical protein
MMSSVVACEVPERTKLAQAVMVASYLCLQTMAAVLL